MNIKDYVIWATLIISVGMCLSVYWDAYKRVKAEYLRRKDARDKYGKDPNVLEGNILQDEFYYPELTYGAIFFIILLYGLPFINLVTLVYLASRWAIKEFKLFLRSPIFPW